MTEKEISNLTFTELVSILLTADGKGKYVKQLALEELLDRKYNEARESARNLVTRS